MASAHLDRESWARLLSGEPFAERQGIERHLAEPCEECEAFLASLPADPVDGAVDLALAGLGRSAPRGNDLEFARILSQARRVPGAARWAALAAAAVLALGGALLAQRLAWPGQTEKGELWIPEIEVSFVVASRDPARGPQLEKGVPGRAYPADRDLLIRFRTSHQGHLSLVRLGADGSAEVIHREPTAPGWHDLRVGGAPAGYPLQGLRGRHRFVVLLHRAQPQADQIIPAAQKLAAEPGPPGSERASASFEIEVLP